MQHNVHCGAQCIVQCIYQCTVVYVTLVCLSEKVWAYPGLGSQLDLTLQCNNFNTSQAQQYTTQELNPIWTAKNENFNMKQKFAETTNDEADSLH